VTRFRLVSQWVFGIFFLWLFWATRYAGQDTITTPVNAFFRIDPFAGASAMLAAREELPFFLPLLLVLPLTLVFGRLFCGWICPLGGALDLAGTASRGKAPAPGGPWSRTGMALLTGSLAASLLGLNLGGAMDPLSLLIRTLALGVVPAAEGALRGGLSLAWWAGGPLRSAAAPVERVLAGHLLSPAPPAFHLSLLFLLLGGALLYAELSSRRFWCRALCPAGALLGCLSARAPLAPRVDPGGCVSCGKCSEVCPMGACAPEGGQGPGTYRISRRDCSGCGRCLGACPERCISFSAGPRGAGEPGPVSLSRRLFLASAAGGAVVPLAAMALPREQALPSDLIRPPGAAPEAEFLARCLRCGECMRVCLTNGLQPTLLEAGVEGIWTPRLAMRKGYCEFNCTLCGQVCPTDAIRPLHPVEKRQLRIGTAIIDRDLCIPFLRGEQCMVCEEHCPTPSKAIVFDDATVKGPGGAVKVKQPRVLRDLCIGCGICETKCPLSGQAAIRVVRDGEDRSR